MTAAAMSAWEPSEVLDVPSCACGACSEIVPIWDFPKHIDKHTDAELARYRGGVGLLQYQLTFIIGASQAAEELVGERA